MKASVFMSVIRSINHLFNSYLSWIVLLMAVLAYMLPAVFSWMTPYIAYMLQFVMFAMGLTLTAQVFIDVFKQPMKVILVSVIQFFFLANGNVPLSVSATTVSTLLAPILTPLFVVLYAGATSSIEIQFMPMFISIVKIVLVPIILGIVLNYFIGSKIEPVKSVCPTIAAIAVLLILAAVTAVNQKQIAETGLIIFVACLVQNLSGYVVTYLVCKALSIDVSSRRAMQIEVAMQNSALSVSLALKHFTPQAAVAGAVFSIIHNFTGSIFAGICRKHDDQEKLENA
ncbi:MAG: bile acid:sodium symporter family protein [Veillonella parvula]|nr:bile acid:sodium symporter family protein [Veillonella parvula]